MARLVVARALLPVGNVDGQECPCYYTTDALPSMFY